MFLSLSLVRFFNRSRLRSSINNKIIEKASMVNMAFLYELQAPEKKLPYFVRANNVKLRLVLKGSVLLL